MCVCLTDDDIQIVFFFLMSSPREGGRNEC